MKRLSRLAAQALVLSCVVGSAFAQQFSVRGRKGNAGAGGEVDRVGHQESNWDCITFDNLLAGTIPTVVFSDQGLGPVRITGNNPTLGTTNAAVIFDSANPTGGDPDLGTPNMDFGGPGVGAGGEIGSPFENSIPLRKILIVGENLIDSNGDGRVDVPDDADEVGSSLVLDFSAIDPVVVFSMNYLDGEIDRPAPMIRFFDATGFELSAVTPLQPGNNGVNRLVFGGGLGIVGVSRVEISVNGSGAYDDICFERFKDCNDNGVHDPIDIASGTSQDCDGNDRPDECQPDCDDDGIPDVCEADCDSDGTPDDCEADCDADGTPDDCETDCDSDGTPDDCEVDCDNDGTPDDCETDCDSDGTPDDCELDCDSDGTPDDCEADCDSDGTPDDCEVDCDSDGTPDDCETDCDSDGTPDDCETDCDSDGTPDGCEADCDADGLPDDCEADCDADGLPDDCEADCDTDGTPDDCETDCDSDGTPDDCETDCDSDGTPDDCEVDCDSDGTPDDCEADCDSDGTPDDCDGPDCNGNGIPDNCDIAGGTSSDENDNGVPDECQCLSKIGNFVWNDIDRDGIQDPSEPGIEGVTVILKDSFGNVIATTTTNMKGYYLFTGLCAGDYVVEVDAGTLPPDFVPSPCNVGTDDTIDNDCSPKPVTLPNNVTCDLTNDFGYNSPCSGLIGDFVWHDLDRDGIQDSGEPGIEGVRVELKDTLGNVLATVTTGPFGFYTFMGLCAGTYVVDVDESTLPPGLVPSPCNVGTDDTIDNDCSPKTVVLPTDYSQDITNDFGYNQPCTGTIGDYVWDDQDNDGLQDANEMGIEGVLIILKDSLGNVLDTVTTGPDGEYLFTELCAGDYLVEVDESTLPPGYVPTLCNVGSNDAIDNDCTPESVTLFGDNDSDLTIDFGYVYFTTGGGGEGCTPGYWKQDHHFDSWPAPFTPTTLFSDVFEDAFPGMTLLDVLNTGGGGLEALGRHTVAALLNAASLGVDYDVTVSDVIDLFNDLFPATTPEYNALKDYFENFNEQGCPLN